MKFNVALVWEHSPARGRIEIPGAKSFDGTILVGWGSLKDGQFSFTDTSPAHICLAVDVEGRKPSLANVRVNVVDTEQPFSVSLAEVPKGDPLVLHDIGVKVFAEEDVWASL